MITCASFVHLPAILSPASGGASKNLPLKQSCPDGVVMRRVETNLRGRGGHETPQNNAA